MVNTLWCADYKGEFILGNREYCHPLTISDYRSRYLLACEGAASTRSDFAFSIFERVFKDFGLPHAIREVDQDIWQVSFLFQVERGNDPQGGIAGLPERCFPGPPARSCAGIGRKGSQGGNEGPESLL